MDAQQRQTIPGVLSNDSQRTVVGRLIKIHIYEMHNNSQHRVSFSVANTELVGCPLTVTKKTLITDRNSALKVKRHNIICILWQLKEK